MDKIRVMIVDDSAFMRKVITDMLSSDPDIEVVGTARDGKDAWQKLEKYQPNLITLDVEMPEVGGLAFLEKLMAEKPLPVIMLSTLTKIGAEATIKALSLGAVDFISKPSGSISLDMNKIHDELIHKVKVAVKAKLKPPKASKIQPPVKGSFVVKPDVKAEQPVKVEPPIKTEPPSGVKVTEKIQQPPSSGGSVQKIVAIGTSTGGPRALQEVIPHLPANLPAAVLIVQHMPKGFTHSLAQRLDQQSKIRVKEAQAGDRLQNGWAFLAPGGLHMVLEKNGAIALNQDPPILGVRPAVDILFKSIAKNHSGQVVGVIMTGMGRDGTEGMTALKEKGAKAIAEEQSTCVVYGMPKSVVDKGLADKVVPLPQIADEIVKMLQGK